MGITSMKGGENVIEKITKLVEAIVKLIRAVTELIRIILKRVFKP